MRPLVPAPDMITLTLFCVLSLKLHIPFKESTTSFSIFKIRASFIPSYVLNPENNWESLCRKSFNILSEEAISMLCVIILEDSVITSPDMIIE